MEQELNLVEILKDCPKGTKLYSTIHGEVEFSRIDTIKIEKHPIVAVAFICGMHTDVYFTNEGKYLYGYDGECVLFPSKDNRDWSKFKVEPELVDGEVYYCSLFNKINSIYIHRKTTRYKTEYYVKLDLCDLGLLENGIITTNEGNIKELRKATEEEKQLFFELIEKNDRKWDADKKELIKIEQKFDISSLQHFDKILVRDCNEQKWKCDFYNSYVVSVVFPFKTVHGIYKQCIPYNEDTKHLVDKNEKPPKKYINW